MFGQLYANDKPRNGLGAIILNTTTDNGRLHVHTKKAVTSFVLVDSVMYLFVCTHPTHLCGLHFENKR
jgi:hypothetical protein